jgi:hypothetical protein
MCQRFINTLPRLLLVIIALCFSARRGEAFIFPSHIISQPQKTGQYNKNVISKDGIDQSRSWVASLAFAALVFTGSPVWADEYGVETEAPTIFTGETVQVGPFLSVLVKTN